MKIVGALLATIGLAILVHAFSMDTSVAFPLESLGVATSDSLTVTNLAELQRQMMLSQIGLVVALAGAVLFAAGSVIDAILGRSVPASGLNGITPSAAVAGSEGTTAASNRDVGILLSLVLPIAAGIGLIVYLIMT